MYEKYKIKEIVHSSNYTAKVELIDFGFYIFLLRNVQNAGEADHFRPTFI